MANVKLPRQNPIPPRRKLSPIKTQPRKNTPFSIQTALSHRLFIPGLPPERLFQQAVKSCPDAMRVSRLNGVLRFRSPTPGAKTNTRRGWGTRGIGRTKEERNEMQRQEQPRILRLRYASFSGRQSCGRTNKGPGRFALPHPRRKSKDAPRVGHPVLVQGGAPGRC